METIRFFFKDEFLAQGDLRPYSNHNERRTIAKSLGIKLYNRVQFVRENGDIRYDSDTSGTEKAKKLMQEVEFIPIQ